MAKHSLPAGTDLIAALKALGQALGYRSETEFPIERRKVNPQAIDVAWLRDEEQQFPLMVFEVESTASNSAANNALKLYSKRAFEKPLFFFHVFIEAGRETSRLDDLREEYGRMNYRNYTICESGVEPLLKDVLSQHRRLSDRLDLAALIGVVRQSCLSSADCHLLLSHAERLGFNSGRGVTLPAYAQLGSEDPSFHTDFYRHLTAQRSGKRRPETDQYPSYFGQEWATPLHLGILSSLQPDPTLPVYFERYRRWHEEPQGPALLIGPCFGLNIDFDDFLAHDAAPFLTLLAILMADVPGATRYLSEQLGTVLGEIRPDRRAVRYHIASWMMHMYAADEQAESFFEGLRDRLNSEGGIQERFLHHPLGGSSSLISDPEIELILASPRVDVPPFSDFRLTFLSAVSREQRRTNAVCLAMRLLSSDETRLTWQEEMLPLLHAGQP